nr:hypothetical protein [bacterium]
MTALHHTDHLQIARRVNFSFVIPDRLAGMGMPSSGYTPEIILFLKECRIQTVVNLSGRDDGLADHFQLLREDVSDFSTPAPEQIDRVWEAWLQLPLDKAMVVHCEAGIGRAGTTLACLIGRQLHLPGAAAIEFVRAIRYGS